MIIFNKKINQKGKGWPANFFEETSGCLKDTPLTIDSECWVSFPQPNLLAKIFYQKTSSTEISQ